MKYKRKAMVCDMEKPEEKELWEFLQTMPHGEYSRCTKEYWMVEMNKEKIRQMRKEMGK